MKPKAYIYIRYSSLIQSKGHSFERQLEGAQSFIKLNKWAYSPDRVMFDEGKSAYHGVNRSVGSLLHGFEEMARSGELDGSVLVVESLDRLTRQGSEETFDLMRTFSRYGVTIATFMDHQIYHAGQKLDLASIITMIVKGQLAHEEIEKRSKRLQSVWDKKFKDAQEGVIITRNVPSWIDIDSSMQMTVNAYRAQLLNQIFDWYIGGHGINYIIRKLNKSGEPTWGNSSSWGRDSVHRMLQNRAALGEYKPPNRDVIANYYPQVISPSKFNQAQSVRATRRGTGGFARTVMHNLFVGLLYCGECGNRGHIEVRLARTEKYLLKDGTPSSCNHRETKKIRCHNNRRAGGCTNKTPINYFIIEEALLDFFFDDAIETVINKEDQSGNQLSELNRLISIEQGKLKNAIDLLIDVPSDSLKQRVLDLEASITKLKSDISQIQVEASVDQSASVDLIRSIRSDIENMDLDARSNAAQAFKNIIDRITFYDDQRFMVQVGNEYFEFNKNGNRDGGTDSYYSD